MFFTTAGVAVNYCDVVPSNASICVGLPARGRSVTSSLPASDTMVKVPVAATQLIGLRLIANRSSNPFHAQVDRRPGVRRFPHLPAGRLGTDVARQEAGEGTEAETFEHVGRSPMVIGWDRIAEPVRRNIEKWRPRFAPISVTFPARGNNERGNSFSRPKKLPKQEVLTALLSAPAPRSYSY